MSRLLCHFFIVVLVGLDGTARSQVATNAGPADDYLIDVWDSERGLPENSVVSLAQTPDGYLWLGTLQAGVARFDGVRFTTFDPVNTPELPRNDTQRLLVDAQGDLWIGMIGGSLVRYEAGKFISETSPMSGKDALRELVRSGSNDVFLTTKLGELFHGSRRANTNYLWEKITPPMVVPGRHYCAASDGRIWYNRADGQLGCWHDGQVEPVQKYPGLRGETVSALTTDPAGHLWVGTEKGLARWENGGFVDLTPTNGESEVAVLDFVFSGDGGLWVSTVGQLRKCVNRQWVVAAQSWQGIPVSPFAEIASLHGDQDGGVWFIHRHEGAWHVQPDGQVNHLTEASGLPNGQLDCWFQDHERNVWLGLEGGGLVRLRPRQFHTLPRPDSAAGAVIRSVCEDTDGGIWLGGSDGKIFNWRAGNFTEVKFPNTRLPVRDVTLWPEAAGGCWLGTVQSGLWFWTNGIMRRPFLGNMIGTVVRALFQDSQKRLWIGNEFGLFCWSHGQLQKFSSQQGFSNREYVLALAEDADGAIWIGTADGHLWQYENGRFTRFAFPPPTPTFRFWSLLTEADGTVWVGTLGGGLLRWREGKLTRCTRADGLPSDTISQLLKDGHGNLWAGSRAGIFSVDRISLNAFLDGHAKNVFCRTFGQSDGLPALECSTGYQPACWRGHDGRLWFATVKGVVSFLPSKLLANPLPPTVKIETVQVDGVAQEIGTGSPSLALSPGRHYVEFRFTGLSLTAPERVRFQWRLEGLERDWVDGGNQRAVSYSYLPPGNYHFHVRACNSDGIWNQVGATLALRVSPHLWEMWWVRLLVPILTIIISGGITLLVIRRRHKLQMDRIGQQRAIERERTRIAQDLHDDLGASLTQVAWLGEAASSAEIPADESQKLVAAITLKSRDMVRAIDEIVWAVNPKNDSLDHLVTYICECADQMFRNTPTRCRVDVPEIIPAQRLSSDVRHNLFLAAKEALHNVAKHAGASRVWVRVKLEPHAVTFVIEDNGRGFAPENKNSGDGLENMRQRSAAIAVAFNLCSVVGQGTTVTWKLPLAGPKIKT